MIKKLKIKLLALSAFACCVALGGAMAVNSNTAKASEDNSNFNLTPGASVRISGNDVSGIRFQANVKESYIASLNAQNISYNMLIAPKKNVESIENLTLETFETTEAISVKTTNVPNFTDQQVDETFTYYASITYDNTTLTEEELKIAHTVELVARPYLAYTENGQQKVVYGAAGGESRSMNQVAEIVAKKFANGEAMTATGEAPSQKQLDSLLSYIPEEEVKAVMEENTTSLEFIDGRSLNGYKAYVVGGTEVEASFVELGTISNRRLDVSAAGLATLDVGETAKIYLANEDGFISTNYRKVTKVIDSVEDLRMFNQTANTQTVHTGYYVLGADIVDTEITYNEALITGTTAETTNGKYYSNGFAGTFDGMGHVLTFKTVYGLFGKVLYGAEIKNVAFNDISLTKTTAGTVLGSGQGLYYQYLDSKALGLTSDDMVVNVSNVYMSLGESWYNNSGASILIFDGDARKHVSYENVIVELSAPPADYTAAPDLVSKIATFSAGETAFKAGFTNVYVVGATTNADTDAKRTDLYKTVGGVIVTADGVKMGTDYSVIANADTIFTSDCWTIVDGKPVWAALENNAE